MPFLYVLLSYLLMEDVKSKMELILPPFLIFALCVSGGKKYAANFASSVLFSLRTLWLKRD